MRALRVTGNVFIVIGATFLFFVLYELVGTAQITKAHQTALASTFDVEYRPPPVIEPAFKPATWPNLDHGDIVARIRIPRIRLRMIVVEGVTLDDLAQGPGHYPQTPLPGEYEPGLSVAIAGHRTGWGSPFINLDRLRKGDEVILETLKRGSYTYRITGSATVEPGDVKVLRGDPDSDAPFKLTLTTCTPKYTSLHRMIFWADQVSPAVPSGFPNVSKPQATRAPTPSPTPS